MKCKKCKKEMWQKEGIWICDCQLEKEESLCEESEHIATIKNKNDK